jgi:hypothetical protein
MHFPSSGPGKYNYNVYACYFKGDGIVDLGPSVQADVDLRVLSPILIWASREDIFHLRLMLIGSRTLISGQRFNPSILIPPLMKRSMSGWAPMQGK